MDNMSEENNITAEEMGSKTWLFHEPWPIDRNFRWPPFIEVSSSFGLSVAQILDIHKRTGNMIYKGNNDIYETFPLDPNAPKNTIQDYVNKGYKLVVIGGGNAAGRAITLSTNVIFQHPCEMDMHAIIEHVAKMNGALGKIGPIPIEPLAEMKLDIEKMYAKEESFVHKVTPREQKNRERLMKRRNK